MAVLAVLLAAFGRAPEQTGSENILVVASPSAPDYLDPALTYQSVTWQLMFNVYDTLLSYRRVGGLEGTELIPDLAEEIPTVENGGMSADGLTYTFKVRRGIKFGPGRGGNRELLPSDLKWSIERLFLMKPSPSPGVSFYMVIDGAEALSEGKAKELSGIVADDQARTITFHLNRPDATFLYKMAMNFSVAVPRETPPADVGNEFVPATGPYMFASHTPLRKIELRRNPNYKPWSKEHVPGYVEGVDWLIGVSPDNAITQVKRGEIDYTLGGIPPSQMPVLLSKEEYEDNIKKGPVATTAYLWMNNDVPPFDNVQVRQAINWAIDRRAMIKLGGGRGEPTENVLPQIMPGYVEHQLYPGPDMDKARQLIAESGITPGELKLWCMTTDPQPTLAAYVQDVLTELGFTVTVNCVDYSAYYSLIGNQRTKAQIGFASWGQDFPEASNFIDTLLNGHHITPEFNHNYGNYRGADAQIEAANKELDLEKRKQMWAALDKRIMQDAPWAPYASGVRYDFTSDRLQNFQQHPVYELIFMTVRLKGTESEDTGGGDQP